MSSRKRVPSIPMRESGTKLLPSQIDEENDPSTPDAPIKDGRNGERKVEQVKANKKKQKKEEATTKSLTSTQER